MKENHRLLKFFLISLVGHLGLLPLFSLTLPAVRKKLPVLEVTLRQLPSSETRKLEVPVIRINEKLPRFATDERIFLKMEEAITRRMTRESLGIQRQAVLTAVQPVPAPEFHVHFPAFPSPPEEKETVSGLTLSEEITGPGGQRKVIYRHQFSYPEWAQKKSLEGNIRFKFWLSPGGQVKQTELIVSSGWPELDILVEDCFRRWLFEPAGEDKLVWGEIVFRLRLK